MSDMSALNSPDGPWSKDDWLWELTRLLWLGAINRSRYLFDADNDDAEPMTAHDIILRREEGRAYHIQSWHCDAYFGSDPE